MPIAGIAMFLVMTPVLLIAYGLAGLIAGYFDASVFWCLLPIPFRLMTTARKAWTTEPKVPEWRSNWLFEGCFFSIPGIVANLIVFYLTSWLLGN